MKAILQQCNKDQINKYILEQDILYNIMLNSDIKEVNSLGRTNKLSNKIYKSIFFWKEKFILNYPMVETKTNDWEKEYKQLYNAGKITINFIEVLILMKKDEVIGNIICNFGDLYLTYDMDINQLTWLPQRLINNFQKEIDFDLLQDVVVSILGFKIIKINPNIFLFSIDITSTTNQIYLEYTISKDEFITFFTLLLYYKPDVIVSDVVGYPYLYKDLIQQLSDARVKTMLRYWKKVLKNDQLINNKNYATFQPILGNGSEF